MSQLTGRFAAPELLQLGPPPNLVALPFDTLYGQSIAKLAEELAAAGIDWDVGSLDANPGACLTRTAVYRDTLRRTAIFEAVSGTFLGSAERDMLDQRAADYGVLRKVVTPATPTTPAVMEDDESLRTRARLAWEALSVAGPAGAYLFHALDAHPDVYDAAVYGPESAIVEPGEVLVVLQGRSETGVPRPECVDSVAARLDAALITYSTGASRTRDVRDDQSVRPLGARVIVKAAQPVNFYVSARIFVRPGPDNEVIRRTAEERLRAYLARRRRVGTEIPRSGIIAALHVADAQGIPIVDEVELIEPKTDVVPAFDELALVSVVTVEAVVR